MTLIQLSEPEIHDIAQAAAKVAIKEWMTALGVDVAEQIEMQKDFAHLRAWRQSTEAAKNTVIKAGITVLVTSILGALWLVIKGH